MKEPSFRITYVNFSNLTAVGLSRDPGALVCAEFHRLAPEQLAIISTAQLLLGPLVLPDTRNPLSILGIESNAIFKNWSKTHEK